MRFDLFLLMSI